MIPKYLAWFLIMACALVVYIVGGWELVLLFGVGSILVILVSKLFFG
jgi:hypothetical protein